MDTDTLTLDEVDLILRMLAEWQGRADELLDRRLVLTIEPARSPGAPALPA